MPINDPRDVADLSLWYSTEANPVQADGAQTLSILDQSGLGNDATIPAGVILYRTTAGPASGPAFELPASGSYTIPAAALSGATQAEIFVYVRAKVAGAGNSLWVGNAGGGGHEHYSFSDGNIYETWCSNTRFSGAVGTPTVANWLRYNIWSAANDWKARLNEVDKITSAVNTFTPPPAFNMGGGHSNFDGYFTTVIIYKRKLTTQERADVSAWMAANPSGGSPFTSLPGTPTGLNVTGATGTELTLNWTASTGDVDGYEVRIDGGTPTDIGDVLSHEFTGLTPSSSYLLEVRAYGPGGDSDWASITGTTTSGLPPVWMAMLGTTTLAGGDADAPSGTSIVGCLSAPPDGLGMPDLRTEDVTYPQRDGVRHFSDWYGPRIITLADVTICPDGCPTCPTARQKVQALTTAWARRCDDTELVIFTDCHGTTVDSTPSGSSFGEGGFGEGGFGGGAGEAALTGGEARALVGPYGVVGRPRVAALQWMRGKSGCATMLLRFDAADHRLFILDENGTPGSGEQCATLTPEISSKCRTYDRCYGETGMCYTVDNSIPGSGPQDIDNFGTLCAPLTITLTGQLTTPRILNETTGQEITYRGTIPTGSTVIINTQDGTATQDGVSRNNLLEGDTIMFADLGVNTFQMLSQSTSDDGSAEVCFRPAVLTG